MSDVYKDERDGDEVDAKHITAASRRSRILRRPGRSSTAEQELANGRRKTRPFGNQACA